MSLNVLSKQSFQRAARLQATRSMTILSKSSGEEYKKMNYTSRMKNSGRPVSPHVTVYNFPIAAVASITNRVTGCVLSFGALGLGAAELLGGSGSALYIMQFVGSQGMLISAGSKFAISFPIVYHYGGGLRHLMWDQYPEMLTNTDVAKSSYQLFAGSALISGALMFM
jgi:succinate dehydrogenase (ubiquinone) cytochrome b560 subunit